MKQKELFAPTADDLRAMAADGHSGDDGGLIWRSIAVRQISAEARTVDVVASTSSLDSHGDIIEQTWDLVRFEANPVVLFAHDHRSLPIGHASNTRVENGELVATLNFVDEKANPLAEQVFQSFKQGSLRAVSVGFLPRDVSVREVAGDHVFVLSNNELHEISAVPIPSNPETLARMRQRALSDAGVVAFATNAFTITDDPTTTNSLMVTTQEHHAQADSLGNAAKRGEEKTMDQEMGAAEVEIKLAEANAQLDTERSKSTALQSRCADLDAELAKQTDRVAALTEQLVERDLDLLVGTKISAAEKAGLLKLASLDREVFDAQLDAIKARPNLPQASSDVLGPDPNAQRASAATTTNQGQTVTAGGSSLAQRVEARNAPSA